VDGERHAVSVVSPDEEAALIGVVK
jgi:hypothetical protein